jgi:hypothetical protein
VLGVGEVSGLLCGGAHGRVGFLCEFGFVSGGLTVACGCEKARWDRERNWL